MTAEAAGTIRIRRLRKSFPIVVVADLSGKALAGVEGFRGRRAFEESLARFLDSDETRTSH